MALSKDQHIQNIKELRKNLEELRDLENKFSTHARFVEQAFERINPDKFTKEDILLINEAKTRFKLIGDTQTIWDTIIPPNIALPEDQGGCSPTDVCACFHSINEMFWIDNHPIKNRLRASSWVTANYSQLNEIIKKDRENANSFLKSSGIDLAIESVILTPFQRLVNLMSFTNGWVKIFAAYPEDHPSKFAVNSLKRKITGYLNTIDELDQIRNKIENSSSISKFFQLVVNIVSNEEAKEREEEEKKLLNQTIQLQNVLERSKIDLNQLPPIAEVREKIEKFEKDLKEEKKELVDGLNFLNQSLLFKSAIFVKSDELEEDITKLEKELEEDITKLEELNVLSRSFIPNTHPNPPKLNIDPVDTTDPDDELPFFMGTSNLNISNMDTTEKKHTLNIPDNPFVPPNNNRDPNEKITPKYQPSEYVYKRPTIAPTANIELISNSPNGPRTTSVPQIANSFDAPNNANDQPSTFRVPDPIRNLNTSLPKSSGSNSFQPPIISNEEDSSSEVSLIYTPKKLAPTHKKSDSNGQPPKNSSKKLDQPSGNDKLDPVLVSFFAQSGGQPHITATVPSVDNRSKDHKKQTPQQKIDAQVAKFKKREGQLKEYEQKALDLFLLIETLKKEKDEKTNEPFLDETAEICLKVLEDPSKIDPQEFYNHYKKIPGSASPAIKGLGVVFLIFGCAVLISIGILAAIPSGGTSLLAVFGGLIGISAGATAGVMTGVGVATLIGGASIYRFGTDSGLSRFFRTFTEAAEEEQKTVENTNKYN